MICITERFIWFMSLVAGKSKHHGAYVWLDHNEMEKQVHKGLNTQGSHFITNRFQEIQPVP